jgi:5-(carboxyamino)imidazole ribonucleotide mutase
LTIVILGNCAVSHIFIIIIYFIILSGKIMFLCFKYGSMQPVVGIIMGSDSDLKIMEAAANILTDFDVPFELTIVSAHRTPIRMVEYARSARDRGLRVIIAGAGGAAHLPGMVASITTLPVIGVPIKSSNSIDGWDSILSILQMPNGVPVATVALNAAKNAGILATEILSVADERLSLRLSEFKNEMTRAVEEKAQKMEREYKGQ